MNGKKSIAEPKQVLVEGPDDERIFRQLVKHLNLAGIQVHSYEGKPNLRKFLRVFAADSNFNIVQSLAITRDADSSASSALQSIQDALKNSGLPIPAAPLSPAGTNPKVILLIVPHGQPSGMLEDVCLESVASDPCIGCVDDFIRCVKSRPNVSFPKPLVKAKVHAYLASRPEPDLRLGEAAEKGYWPFAHAAFASLKQLLQML